MKLYNVVGSPNCRKVLAVINHLGLDVEIAYLDFFSGDLTSTKYLRINPNGRVPALRDGDFSLWESNAIMQYLADQVPGNSLFPDDPATRADIVRWQCWELAHYNRAFGTLAFETVAKPQFALGEPDAALVANALEDMNQFAPVLEGHLTSRDYAVGDDITLADYSLIHVEPFKEQIPFDWSGYPNLNAYYERMRAVPHWAQTAPGDNQALGRKPDAA